MFILKIFWKIFILDCSNQKIKFSDTVVSCCHPHFVHIDVEVRSRMFTPCSPDRLTVVTLTEGLPPQARAGAGAASLGAKVGDLTRRGRTLETQGF